MKKTSLTIFLLFLIAGPFAVARADSSSPLTLTEIFSKANSIQSLSYQTKVTSPANTVRKFKIWIHGENVYTSGMLDGIKQIGNKSYMLYNDKWTESPGLTINTVVRFMKEAQAADDTRIIGQEMLDNIRTTVIEYTQPRPSWGSEIKIRLWISPENLIPVRVKATNITQNKIQTEEITDISFDENKYQEFFREIEEKKERRRRAKEKPKPWHPEKEKEYLKLLQIDQEKNLTADQKRSAWEDFVKNISENDPSTRRDDQMRFESRKRIYYWKYASRFHFEKNNIVKDARTGIEWIAGPDRDISLEEARSWVAGLTVDGGGWRLPTIDELKSIYERGVYERCYPPFFKNTGWLLWSGEKRKPAGTWCFSYQYGRKYAYGDTASKNLRAVAVRDSKK